MKKKLKIFLSLIILFTLYIFMCAYSYSASVSESLQNSIFRLHVIANSDLEEDQNLKYIVRDELINYMNSLSESQNLESKSQVIEIAKMHIDDFQKVAEETVKKNGFTYPVSVEIGNFEFPTKKYGDITFPAGFYDALEVKIGSASGKNWWCVMFPPLCFINPTNGVVSEESKETLKTNLSNEEYQLISDTQDSKYTFKFKIVEFFKGRNLITAYN